MARKRTEKEWENHQFPRESALQNYVMKRLKQLPNTHFFKVADRFTSGISDIIGVVNGKFIAIELKVGYNKPTKLQEMFITLITKAGGVGGVAYTWGEVKDIIKKVGYVWEENTREE